MDNTYNDTGKLTFRTTAGVTAYRVLVQDSSGHVSHAGLGAVNPVGIAHETVAADSTGANVTVRSLNHPGSFFMVASGAISRGAPVYPAASGKISATPQGVYLGMANQAASADGDIIEVLIAAAPPSGTKLLVAVAASSALTASSTETSFGSTYSFPASVLQAGDVIHITSSGIATATNANDTLTVKAYVGSTAVFTTGAVDVSNNDVWYISGDVTIRTTGASGTFVGTGLVALGAEGTVTGKVDILASTTLDTTAAVVIDVKGTWSSTNAGNSCRQDTLIITKV